jgi:Spy/CpxP family protein refolding chaperone
MNGYWRQLLLAAVVAGAAGFAGVWMGARQLAPQLQASSTLPNVVDELRAHGLQGLTAAQVQQLSAIGDQYRATRTRFRHSITASNFELGSSLAEETRLGPKTQAAIDRVKSTVGDMQQAAVEYTLALRAVLTPEQQQVFDDKVVEALMTDPGPR